MVFVYVEANAKDGKDLVQNFDDAIRQDRSTQVSMTGPWAAGFSGSSKSTCEPEVGNVRANE
jgi:hypothetical protein